VHVGERELLCDLSSGVLRRFLLYTFGGFSALLYNIIDFFAFTVPVLFKGEF